MSATSQSGEPASTSYTDASPVGRTAHGEAERRAPHWVHVPEMRFVRIDGSGLPSAAGYAAAIGTLFGVTDAVRFVVCRDVGVQIEVGPLETVWWSGTPSPDDCWSIMINQPEVVTPDHVEAALDLAATTGLPSLELVDFVHLTEGLCAQLLYQGPYELEGRALCRLHEFIAKDGYRFDPMTQPLHEIYLNDPRTTQPAALRTVLRQAVAPR